MKLTLTVDSSGGISLELDGNQLGTTLGQVVPAGGLGPFRGLPRQTSPDADFGTATANPFGMSDAETLDCLGPSWAAMSTTERRGYGARPVTLRRNAA